MIENISMSSIVQTEVGLGYTVVVWKGKQLPRGDSSCVRDDKATKTVLIIESVIRRWR